MIEIVGDLATIDGKILNNEDFIYISDGTWYVEGSICWLDGNCGHAGALMVGIVEREGNLSMDGEMCSWDELYIYSKDRELLATPNI
jgi:hypothetical protein